MGENFTINTDKLNIWRALICSIVVTDLKEGSCFLEGSEILNDSYVHVSLFDPFAKLPSQADLLVTHFPTVMSSLK